MHRITCSWLTSHWQGIPMWLAPGVTCCMCTWLLPGNDKECLEFSSENPSKITNYSSGYVKQESVLTVLGWFNHHRPLWVKPDGINDPCGRYNRPYHPIMFRRAFPDSDPCTLFYVTMMDGVANWIRFGCYEVQQDLFWRKGSRNVNCPTCATHTPLATPTWPSV